MSHTDQAARSVHGAQASRATCFRDLHQSGRLLLPNAWDAVSARIFEQAGFPAIGTTSAGVAFTRGYRDAEQIGRDLMVRELASIAAAVTVPLSADIEAGYGPAPADVAATVTAVLDAGIVGVNLEDSMHQTSRAADVTSPDAPSRDATSRDAITQGATSAGAASPDAALFTIDAQQARLAAARAAAEARGIPLVINARTDIFLMNLGDHLEQRIAMAIARGRAYLQAGADIVFIPGVVDPAVVQRLAEGIGGPISLMAGPGAPPADALFTAGASRVSLGPAAMLATLGVLRTIATDLRATGAWTSMDRSDFYNYRDVEALFAPRP